MTYLTRLVFGAASLVLLLAAAALVGFGVKDALHGIGRPDHSGADAVLDVLGYVIVAIAVFDVAKYIFEDEVRRGSERRSASEARRSLTKFLCYVRVVYNRRRPFPTISEFNLSSHPLSDCLGNSFNPVC